MKHAVWIIVLILVVIHQDIWFWDDDRLVFGFMPVALFYHACISVAAGITWFLAIKYAWPEGLDEESESSDAGGAA